MSSSFNKAWAIAKINFRHLKLAYVITAVLVLAGCSNFIQDFSVAPPNGYADLANYFCAAGILAAVFIPAINFQKIMHLGAKKIDFYWGALLNYGIFSAAASCANIVLFLLEKTVIGSRFTILNLVGVFGWISHGLVLAFFQEFFFLLLVTAFIHTLTTVQTFWVGWVADIVIAAIISVFTPIPILRSALVWFFNLIIFNANAAVQMISCLVLAFLFYAAGLFALRRKKI